LVREEESLRGFICIVYRLEARGEEEKASRHDDAEAKQALKAARAPRYHVGRSEARVGADR